MNKKTIFNKIFNNQKAIIKQTKIIIIHKIKIKNINLKVKNQNNKLEVVKTY